MILILTPSPCFIIIFIIRTDNLLSIVRINEHLRGTFICIVGYGIHVGGAPVNVDNPIFIRAVSGALCKDTHAFIPRPV